MGGGLVGSTGLIGGPGRGVRKRLRSWILGRSRGVDRRVRGGAMRGERGNS